LEEIREGIMDIKVMS